jgi:hypothetical protein
MPVILATQEAEISIPSQPRQIVLEALSRKYLTQKGLVRWLKVWVLSSSPSTTKKKKKPTYINLYFVRKFLGN